MNRWHVMCWLSKGKVWTRTEGDVQLVAADFWWEAISLETHKTLHHVDADNCDLWMAFQNTEKRMAEADEWLKEQE